VPRTTPGQPTTTRHKPVHPPLGPSGISADVRCLVCVAAQHTTEAHARRLPYDEARALLDQTPCMAHFACIGRLTCQKSRSDRD
jgi:hypothetical protein